MMFDLVAMFANSSVVSKLCIVVKLNLYSRHLQNLSLENLERKLKCRTIFIEKYFCVTFLQCSEEERN